MKKSIIVLNFIVFLVKINIAKSQSFCVSLKEKGTMAVVDKLGKIVFKIDTLNCEVNNHPDLPDGILVANPKDWKQKRSYFIDLTGKIIKTIPNYRCSEFTHGYSTTSRKTPSDEIIFAVFNLKGELVLEGNFDVIQLLGEDLIAYRIRHEKQTRLRNLVTGKEFFLNNTIQEIYYDTFSEGLIRFKVKKEGKQFFGYFNKFGKIVIPAIYDYAYPFSEGLASVVKEEQSFFIDKSGVKKVGNSKMGGSGYHLWGPKFVNGLANVSNLTVKKIGGIYPKGAPSGYINKKGEWIIKADKYNFCQASHFNHGIAVALDYNRVDDSYTTRFINTKGETILSGIYGDYNATSVFWNEQFIYIYPTNTLYNHQGKVIWEPNFATMFVTKKVEFEKADPTKIEYLMYDDEIDYYPELQSKFQNCNNLERLFFTSKNKAILKKVNIFKNLKLFMLSGRIDELPAELMELNNLEEIKLLNTGLSVVSTDLLKLPKLKSITFESNSKLKISAEFRRIAKEKKIEISETELPIINSF